MDLQDLLGVSVDVVSEAGMRERFRAHALRDAVPPVRADRLLPEDLLPGGDRGTVDP